MTLSLEEVRVLCRAVEYFAQNRTISDGLSTTERQELNRLRLKLDRRRAYLTRIHEPGITEDVENPYT